MVTSSLVIWRGDLCLYSCRSKTRTSAWKTRTTPGSLAQEYVPSHRAGRKCLLWHRDTLCCCHALHHLGLPTASPQRHQKYKRCGKQRNPESHSVCLQLHCASCDIQCRLDVYLAACLLTQVETPQPQTSMPHLTEVNRKQPVTVRCFCRRRLYIGVYSEMVCTFRGRVQGTRIKVSTKLGGNGEAFKLVWVRPSGKPRGSSLSGCSPLSSLLWCCQKKVFLQKWWPQSRELWPSSGRAAGTAGSRAATGSAAHSVLQRIPLPVPLLSPQPFDYQHFGYDHPCLFHHLMIYFKGLSISQIPSLYCVTHLWSFTQLAVQGTY